MLPRMLLPTGYSPWLTCRYLTPDFLASVTFQVEEDLYDSDHFPIVTSVDLHSPLQPGPTLFNWPLICREINSNLQLVSGIDYESFHKMVLCAMTNHSVIRSRPSKCLPAWWTTSYSNLYKQKESYLKRARLLVSSEYWLKYKRTSAKLRRLLSTLSSVTRTLCAAMRKTLAFCIRFSVNSKIVRVLLRIHTFVFNLMTLSVRVGFSFMQIVCLYCVCFSPSTWNHLF